MGKLHSLCAAFIFIVFGIAKIPVARGQDAAETSASSHSLRYRLVDAGTLGGPNTYQPFGFVDGFFTERALSARGAFAGFSDTPNTDPYDPSCFFDCFIDHAVEWRNGKLIDLGTIPGSPGASSVVTSIAADGLISGVSENGHIDPLSGKPAAHGVIWINGKIVDLGTLRGGTASWANNVNDFGQAVGYANNAVTDENSLKGLVTETRAFLWQGGVMRDLGTLGGSDAVALFINDRGQVVGQSYTRDSLPPDSLHCGEEPLTVHAFMWQHGSMQDLGTLGGSCSYVYGLNIRGEAVGQSTTKNDAEDHPYLWQHGEMTDLGTLGGTYGLATWLNDRAEVVGASTHAGDQDFLAFHWQNGKMKELPRLPGDRCSVADAINFEGQVVGGSGVDPGAFFPDCTDSEEHAVLWDDGKVIDLNEFVPEDSELTLNEASYINEFGEITGLATLPDGSAHAFLLIPCRAGENCERVKAKSASDAIAKARASTMQRSRVLRGRRFCKIGCNRR